jgi:hypothetical protein
MNVVKTVAYPALVALGASFGTLLTAACTLGFEVREWSEIHGRIVGVLATIVGLLGAGVGLSLALSGERPATK